MLSWNRRLRVAQGELTTQSKSVRTKSAQPAWLMGAAHNGGIVAKETQVSDPFEESDT
jgi:hypothetical protein